MCVHAFHTSLCSTVSYVRENVEELHTHTAAWVGLALSLFRSPPLRALPQFVSCFSPAPSTAQVCGGLALSLFRYDELELLVCGLPHLDFLELQRNAKYDGGYSAESPTVRAFWQVVQGFNTEQVNARVEVCRGARVRGPGVCLVHFH